MCTRMYCIEYNGERLCGDDDDNYNNDVDDIIGH